MLIWSANCRRWKASYFKENWGRKKQAILKYAELSKTKYQNLGEHNSRTDAYCRLIESHSYFNAKNIGSVIASLIRIFEGTNYIYQKAEYHTTEVEMLAFEWNLEFYEKSRKLRSFNVEK